MPFVQFKYNGRSETALIVSKDKFDGEISPQTFGLASAYERIGGNDCYDLYAAMMQCGDLLAYAVKKEVA